MSKRDTHTNWRKLPEDEYYLETICRQTGLNQASVIRLAIRDYAHRHGYVLREYQDILLTLDRLGSDAKDEKLKAKAQKHVKRNLRFLLDYEDVPETLERDVLFSELLSRYRMSQNQRKARRKKI